MDFIPEGRALGSHCTGAHGVGEIADAVFGSQSAMKLCVLSHLHPITCSDVECSLRTLSSASA